MYRRHVRNGGVLAALLAASIISCSAGSPAPAGGGEPSQHSEAAQNPDTWPEGPPSASTEDPTPAPEAVRDAFATLQATLDDSCTPGNCEYLLTRVHRELMELDEAMKTDPKGPGHFPEPIAWIEDLRKALDGDSSFENLKQHQTLLIGTRDRIDVWMQDHPDDYR